MQYQIVFARPDPLVVGHDDTHKRLARQVNDLIHLGWEPQGGVAADKYGDLYQAMVKRSPR